MKYTLSDQNRRLREDTVHTKSTARSICVLCAYWDKWGRAHMDPLTAVRAQLRHLLRGAVNIATTYMPSSECNDPKPYKSLLTEGCVESGRDFNARGATYDYYRMMLVGIPDLVDSLAAIRKLIYENRAYTMTELITALRADWEGYEPMRLDFLRKAPKFGNDDDEVDLLARELTALLNSIAKLPTTCTQGTTSAIVEVDPKLFCDENIPYLADILLTAAERGLSNVQFNTVSVDTLLDARAHPENHRNLAVRVSGFSQKFNLLNPTVQDHIIARTKHARL